MNENQKQILEVVEALRAAQREYALARQNLNSAEAVTILARSDCDRKGQAESECYARLIELVRGEPLVGTLMLRGREFI